MFKNRKRRRENMKVNVKRNISAVLAVVMLFSFSCVFTYASDNSKSELISKEIIYDTEISGNAIETFPVYNINVGDYLQMGSYCGEPILWRCIKIDENGPLMLSDKILCIKPFDASGTNISGSHGRGSGNGGYRQSYGSNYWGDSNIRDWLNSDADAGNVVWSCGNPPDKMHVWNGYDAYDKEAGFLNEFTESEKLAIKTVAQKQLLEGYEYSITKDENCHRYNDDLFNVIQNYDTAYSEITTEKVFLLDVKQVYDLYKEFGDYYKAYCTPNAVMKSEYKLMPLKLTSYADYWLRSPADIWYGRYAVRTVSYEGYIIHHNDPYNCNVGVRPAFYLNNEFAVISNGGGNEDNPYILKGNGNVENFYGDVDCNSTITAADATYVLQKSLVSTFKLPIEKKTDDWQKFADVDKDTNITANDAALIFQKTLISTFEKQ